MKSFKKVSTIKEKVLNKYFASRKKVKDKKYIIKFDTAKEIKLLLKKNKNFDHLLKTLKKSKDSSKFSNLILSSIPTLNSLGFVVFDINKEKKFNLEEQEKVYQMISSFYGKLLPQNAKQEILVKVYDRGKSLKEGARYHESNVAGNLHTDSPQWVLTPSTVGLLCVNKAISGGDTLLVDAHEILKKIITKFPKYLSQLMKKYHFDKRGDIKKGEKETTFASILSFKKNKLYFRYLRDYIETGHIKTNKKLSSNSIETFNCIDKMLTSKKFQRRIKLKPGQCIFFNNNFIVHGRTAFKDHKQIAKKRLYLRLWMA